MSTSAPNSIYEMIVRLVRAAKVILLISWRSKRSWVWSSGRRAVARQGCNAAVGAALTEGGGDAGSVQRGLM